MRYWLGVVSAQHVRRGVELGITDDEIWQADEGDFRPHRRRVEWAPARPVALADLRARLLLTSTPSWGMPCAAGCCPSTRRTSTSSSTMPDPTALSA